MRIKVPSACAVTVVVFAACLVPLSSTSADPDLWGHLRFGRDTLRDGSIATTDPYSYMTAGSHWMNHEWLAEVIFAAAYNFAGVTGLIALKTSLGMLVAGAVFVFLRSQGITAVRSGIFLFAALSGMLSGLGTLRPQLFTYLAFSAVLFVIHVVERQRLRWAAILPPVFALWANLHGGFLAGVAMVGLWLGIRLVRFWRRGDSTDSALEVSGLLLVGLTCGLALLANPYGYRLPLFLLRTATIPRPEISEWTPLQLVTANGGVYLFLLVTGSLGVAFASKRQLVTVIIFCLMAAAPLVAVRHLPLFALTYAFFAAPLIADAWTRWKGDVSDALRRRWLSFTLITVSVLCLFMALPNFRCIRLVEKYPVQAVDLLKRSEVNGNLAVSFNWGEYVIWHLGPHVRVSVDGRRETVYPFDAYRKALDFWSGRGDWDAVLRAGADLALVEKDGAAGNLLRLHPDWIVVREDDVSRLFVRRGSPQSDILARAVTSTRTRADRAAANACFP